MDGRHSEAGGRQVFRPRRVLAGLMAAAGILWVTVLVYLLRFEDVPLKTFLAVIFFVVFFGVSLVYYARTRIEVDARGMTYCGMVRTRHYAFNEIRKVDVMPGPVTVYAIRDTGGGFVHFTSIFQHHRRLAALLVERAGLRPLTS
jgi:hypothetical protein